MRKYVVTAVHNGPKIKRFGTYTLESTSKKRAEEKIREYEGEDKNWPPGTKWSAKRKK